MQKCDEHSDMLQRMVRVETTTTATHALVVAMDRRQRALATRLAWIGGGVAALCAAGGLLFGAVRLAVSIAQAAQ